MLPIYGHYKLQLWGHSSPTRKLFYFHLNTNNKNRFCNSMSHPLKKTVTTFYYVVNVLSVAFLQQNNDSVDLRHTTLTCKWSRSVGCLFACFFVIIYHYSKGALTVICCQICLIFTSKGYALCSSKWPDIIHCDNTSDWCLSLHFALCALQRQRSCLPAQPENEENYTQNVQYVYKVDSFTCHSGLKD